MSPHPVPAAFLGVLLLDTCFPRPPGDVGHAQTWRMPVRFATVRGASPRRVVVEGDAALLRPFADAAHALVREGAGAITTSCGFLVRLQAALQAALPVPVWSSSLLKLRGLADAGVVTVDAASLGAAELQAAGADPATPVEGLEPGCHLQRVLLDDRPQLDARQAQADAVAAAQRLVACHPRIRQIVLECTNLPPHAQAIEAATGRVVHHLPSFVHERWAGLH